MRNDNMVSLRYLRSFRMISRLLIAVMLVFAMGTGGVQA